MSRKPKLEVVFDPNREVSGRAPFRVNIPGSLTPDGKRRREFFESRTAAMRRVREIRACEDLAFSLPPMEQRSLLHTALTLQDKAQALGFESLGEFGEMYLKQAEKDFASPTFQQLVAPYLKDFPAESTAKELRRIEAALTPGLFQKRVATMDTDFWRDEIAGAAEQREWSAKTFNETVKWIRSIYEHAIRNKRVKDNPLSAIVARTADVGEVSIFTAAELEWLLRRCLREDRELAFYFALLCFSGLRPTEEFEGALWENVEWEDGYLTVHDSKNKSKTGKVNRHVTLNPTLLSWLHAARRGAGINLCPLPMSTKQARARRRAMLTLPDGNVLAGYGVVYRDVTRHSFGSHLAPVSDIETVRREMGHADYQTFKRHYEKKCTRREAEAYWALTYEALSLY